MGSWLYAYLIRGSNERLNATAALHELRREGLEPDSTGTEVIADKEGHCEPRGRELDLGTDAWGVASGLLSKDIDFLMMIRNSELYLACCFSRYARQPHIFLGWSFALFRGLNEDRRQVYMRIIARFAEVAKASSVVIVLEPPGYFEDRIVEVESELLVDAQLTNGRTIEVQEVWVSKGSASIIGATLIPSSSIGIYQRNLARLEDSV